MRPASNQITNMMQSWCPFYQCEKQSDKQREHTGNCDRMCRNTAPSPSSSAGSSSMLAGQADNQREPWIVWYPAKDKFDLFHQAESRFQTVCFRQNSGYAPGTGWPQGSQKTKLELHIWPGKNPAKTCFRDMKQTISCFWDAYLCFSLGEKHIHDVSCLTDNKYTKSNTMDMRISRQTRTN